MGEEEVQRPATVVPSLKNLTFAELARGRGDRFSPNRARQWPRHKPQELL